MKSGTRGSSGRAGLLPSHQESPAKLKQVEELLLHNKDPLAGIEPEKMWNFEKDFDPQGQHHPGKFLKIEYDIMPMNFVPGGWVYFLNTDPISYERTRYEGSNAIYPRQNKFDDRYNDNNHSYSYFQKLDEVYQWCNGFFG